MAEVRQLLAGDAAKLAATLALDSSDARLEVQYLLQHSLQKNRAWLLAHPEYQLNETALAAYETLLRRRLQGEPVAYILGEREFYGLRLNVNRDVLIPRPETELLVGLALERLPSAQPSSASGRGSRASVLDLGTGSGAIALAIAHERPDVAVTAVDASAAALDVARRNARDLGLRNVNFVCADWFAGLAEQRFELIVSNPPYVATKDPHLRQGDLPFEPDSALVSGADGLDDIRHIIGRAPVHLQPDGWLLLEHGYDQAGPVRELLQRAGFSRVFSEPDLSGVERVSGGAWLDRIDR